MLARTLNLFRFYLRITSYLLPLLAFVTAALIRFHFPEHDFDPAEYFNLLLLATVAWAIAAEHYGVTNPEKLLIESTGARSVLAATGVTYVVLLAVVFFYRVVTFSRLFFPLSAVALIVLALALRALFRKLVGRGAFGAAEPIGVLIVGSDRFARRTATRLTRMAMPRCRVVGFVRVPGEPRSASAPVPIYDLADFASAAGVQEVVIALPPERWSQIRAVLPALERLSVPVRAVLELGRGIAVGEKFFRLGRLNVLDLGFSPVDSLSYLLLKRAFDVLFALSVLVITAPLLLLIAAAIRLTSRGPALFVQERVGLNGKVFRMYKFRTMRRDAALTADTQWTRAHDPRCTPLGRWLRAWSLDELPQFLNVLKGDMSVVGPRPERPHFVRNFLDDVARYNTRHRLKVGITGWAQVNGLRGDTSIRRRVMYDLYYLQNWSLGFDLRIIFLTLAGGVFSKNAY
jgi:Undecaprenyl-phosphate glucose phosphotransferase